MKKCLILGNLNAAQYKDIFPLIKNNQLWVKNVHWGYTWFLCKDSLFDEAKHSSPERCYKKDGKFYWRVNGVRWYTNIGNNSNSPIELTKQYVPEKYPKYDNYDAIDSKTLGIPKDYNGPIGVPISFFDHYNPSQFEIVGQLNPVINGKPIYKRIIIKRK